MFERSARNRQRARQRRAEFVNQKIEKLPKLNKKKIFTWSIAAVTALNLGVSTRQRVLANEMEDTTIENTEQITDSSISANFEPNTTSVSDLEQETPIEINNQDPATLETELQNDFTEQVTPVHELEQQEAIDVYPGDIEIIEENTPVAQSDIDNEVQAFLDSKNEAVEEPQTENQSNNYQESVTESNLEIPSVPASPLPEISTNVSSENDNTPELQNRLEAIRSHSFAGSSKIQSIDNRIPHPEFGAVVSTNGVINQDIQAEIIDEGNEYPTIQTTDSITTISESSINDATEYSVSQESEVDFLTFEITGLQQNRETGEYENVVGTNSGFIQPDGSFQPTDNQRIELNNSNDPEPVSQETVDTFLQPGITSRAGLHEISTNFSAPVSITPDPDSISYGSQDEILNRQTIQTQETTRITKGDDKKTTVTRRDSRVSLVEDHPDIQRKNRELVRESKSITPLKPIKFQGKSLNQMRKIIADASIAKQKNTSPKIIIPAKSRPLYKPGHSPIIDKRTPLHRQTLLQKLSNLANTAISIPDIGHRQSTVKTEKKKKTGTFKGFDIGLRRNRDIKVSTDSSTNYYDFNNIFRVGAENDSAAVATTINGQIVDNSQFLFGIIAGLDRGKFKTTNTTTHQYFDRNILSGGISGGLVNGDKYISARTSINHDLYSGKTYPQLQINGGVNKKRFGVNTNLNLSTNPTFTNPNQISTSGFWNFRNQARNIARVYTKLKFGIGKNHELFRDETKFGVQVFPTRRLTIDLSHSPRISNNSNTKSSASVNWRLKWGSIFSGVSLGKNQEEINGGVRLKINPKTSIDLQYQKRDNQFRGNEHIGTFGFKTRF